MPADSPQAQPAPRRKALKRLRALLRVALVSFAVLCLLAVGAFWMATRSWFIIWRLTPELEDRLGGEVQIASARYDGDRRVTFEDVTLRVRGLAGAAAEVANIGRATVTIDLASLVPLKWRLSDVEINSALVRVSEDERSDGLLNLWALRPNWPKGGGKQFVPPRIRLRHAALEFGRHADGHYAMVDKRLFTGDLQPAPGAPHMYNFRLNEVDEQGLPVREALVLTGELNAVTKHWRTYIEEVELNRRIYDMCPAVVQRLWSNMDLQGTVRRVEATLAADQTFSISLNIHNVNLTLPVESAIDWARYRGGVVESTTARPRLHFAQGAIRVTNDSLELTKLVGEVGSAATDDAGARLVNVPYELSFVMRPLPALDWETPDRWMNEVLKKTPFELDFRVSEFNLKRDDVGAPPAVDLPLVLANILQKFGVSDCLLSTKIEVQRQDDATKATGQAFLRHATGRYRKFPYQLENVDAYLQFDPERVIVHYLTGTGAGASKFRITGEIVPPTNDAAISLRLVGTDVPVDDRLRAALSGGELKAFDMFFNHDVLAAMTQRGQVPDAPAIETAVTRLAELKQRRAALTAARGLSEIEFDAALEPQRELDAQIARLQRSIDAGPFQLGGLIDVDLRIDRLAGDKQPTITTGMIDVHSIGMMYERFPYPLRFTSGRLDWQRDRIVATSPGLKFVTPGGGMGTATGEMIIARRSASNAGQTIRPALELHVIDDEFTPALEAAIDEGLAARKKDDDMRFADMTPGEFVADLGLQGGFDCRGTINTDEATDRVHYNFVLQLNGDRADFQPRLANVLGTRGEVWPHDARLTDVTGLVHIDRNGIVLEKVGAKIPSLGDGLINASGHFRWNPPPPEMDVADAPAFLLNGLITQGSLESPLMLDLLRLASQQDAVRTYERAGPAGIFDAEFHVAADAVGKARDARNVARDSLDWNIVFRPRTLGLTWRERQVAVAFDEWDGGGIEVNAAGINLRDVHGRHENGVFRVDGLIEPRTPFDLDLRFTHVGQIRSEFMLAFVPDAVLNSLDAIKFDDAGASVLEDCHLHVRQVPPQSSDEKNRWATEFSGPVRVGTASLEAGVKFTDVAATALIQASYSPGQPLTLEMQLDVELARAMGQYLRNGEASISLVDSGTALRLHELRADAGQGIVVAHAWAGVGEERDFEISLDMAGVPLGNFSFAADQAAPEATASAEPSAVYGELYANISISGTRGEPENRRGRAVMRVINGHLANVPLAMQLMQFTVGTGDLDSAAADMYLFGDRLFFTPINFEATSGNTLLMQFSGEGEMDVQTLELKNTRFRTRSGMPLIRDIVGEVSDRLYTIEVTGPLNKPRARVVPLPSSN